jgi:hypothetical protein
MKGPCPEVEDKWYSHGQKKFAQRFAIEFAGSFWYDWRQLLIDSDCPSFHYGCQYEQDQDSRFRLASPLSRKRQRFVGKASRSGRQIRSKKK